jgi:hypothetical protein
MTFDRTLLPGPATYFENQSLILKGPRSAKWKTTNCNFHGGSDSMRVNVATGAWVCMSCNAKGGDVLAYHMAANCLDFVSAAKDLGAWQDDGKPSRDYRPKPIPAGQAISVLAFESHLTAIAASTLAQGKPLTDIDRSRLLVAAGRIQHIAQVYA